LILSRSFKGVIWLISICLVLGEFNVVCAAEDSWAGHSETNSPLIVGLTLPPSQFEFATEFSLGLGKNVQMVSAGSNSDSVGEEKPNSDDSKILATKVILPIAGAIIGGFYGHSHWNGSQPGMGTFLGGVGGFLIGLVCAIRF
jgi:hypothetical protein